MRVAVTISIHQHTDQPRDFLQHTYVPYLEPLGLIPILVPNIIADPVAYVRALDVQGFVLTGGGDVAPERYGEADSGTETESISPARDSTEYHLLEFAVERSLPVVGICRGMQMINVFFGGSLIQDIPSQLRSPIRHDGNPSHALAITDARFAQVLQADRIEVNSFHHQGVTADRLAPELDSFALSEIDGVIEGVAHQRCPVLGVQWHPERPTPSRETDLRLLRHFLKEGAFWQNHP